MNRNKINFLKIFSAFMFIITCMSITFAQTSVEHNYRVTSNNPTNLDLTVKTSIDSKIISVAIQRKNNPTHFYTSYPEIQVSNMRIEKKTVFTIYHKDERIKAGTFDRNFSQISGSARRKRQEIFPIWQKLKEDMEILRAIRAFDKNAEVTLAELSYVIVTYDNSIIDQDDSSALNNFNVTEIPQVAKIQSKRDTTKKTTKFTHLSNNA